MAAENPTQYLDDTSWVSGFGTLLHLQLEDWGMVQAIRVHYQGRLEVEFGITSPHWAAAPPDVGTRRVLKDGVVVLLDRDGALTSLVSIVQTPT